MPRNWNLRQLFAEKKNKTTERETAEQSVSLTGMIESGDFKIDLAARTVTLRGENLSLTAEEFDVLVFLAGHPQRLVTPHTVLATSWPANGLRQTEFLRVLMSLSKKLDAAGQGTHYLKTEPWVIYRFDPTSSSAG
jgi:two-component system, OmpR family, KDP operon response regulator KdpE